MYSPGVDVATIWPGSSTSIVGAEPSPQSIVAVYELSGSGSVNWPVRVIVSPSVATGSERFRSAAVNCGATSCTTRLADAWPVLYSSLVTWERIV